MRIHLLAICIALTTVSVYAGSVDEAEAKKRGVTVEVVQLENAKARIVVLEKQVADLQKQLQQKSGEAAIATAEAASCKAQLAKIQDGLSPEQKSKLTAREQQQQAQAGADAEKKNEIEAAIHDKRVIVGMTLDDVKRICVGNPDLQSQSTRSSDYICYVNGRHGAVEYFITIEGGIITSLSIEESHGTAAGTFNPGAAGHMGVK